MMKKGLLVLVFALVGCGGSSDDGQSPSDVAGGVDIAVQSNALLNTPDVKQHFCMTWTVYQLTEGASPVWEEVDKRTEPICAADGVDMITDLGVCYDGRAFLVEYTAYLYQLDETGAEQLIATLQAASGGGAEDICVKDTDTPTTATIQWANPGDIGGVNPGLNVDQICFNDKVEQEGDRLVSALWLQPESCGEGTPDMFCALTFASEGSSLATVRTGLSSDGLVRYIFNSSGLGEVWDIFYLAFDEGLAPLTLHLFNSAWVRAHYSDPTADPTYGKVTIPAIGSWYYAGVDSISVGFLNAFDTSLAVVFDQTGNCNRAIDVDAKVEVLDLTVLCVSPVVEGVSEAGGTTFNVVVRCGAEDIRLIPCDVSKASAICTLPAPAL